MSRVSPLPLRLLLLGVLVVVVPACGKRGPPLPPLHPRPEPVANLSIVRREGDVTLRFTSPIHNLDGSDPVLFDRVEIYALTVPAGGVRPALHQVFTAKNRVGEAGRRSISPGSGLLGSTSPGSATPPVPAEDPSAPAAAVPLTFVEKVATVASAPVAPPAPAAPVAPAGAPAAPATTAGASTSTTPPEPATLPVTTRFYAVVPYANRTRAGGPSEVLAVPLGPLPLAPHDAAITYDDQTLTLKWITGGEGQSFHVYDAAPGAGETAKAVTATALTAAEFKQPVVFGTPVCFAVRGVRTVGSVTLESAPSNVTCETPADTFPPPAPAGLAAFAATGAITLTWDAVTAADLGGYIVLRGEGTGDRLQPLTAAPVQGTSFTDSTTRAGVRYVYAVVAVDRATPANRSKESNRVEETGR